MNEVVPKEIKLDLHCLLVTHGKHCHRCAANNKPQFPPKDGSKLDCPLVSLVARADSLSTKGASGSERLLQAWKYEGTEKLEAELGTQLNSEPSITLISEVGIKVEKGRGISVKAEKMKTSFLVKVKKEPLQKSEPSITLKSEAGVKVEKGIGISAAAEKAKKESVAIFSIKAEKAQKEFVATVKKETLDE